MRLPIRLLPRPSRSLATALAVAHAGAAAGLAATSLPLLAKVALLATLAGSLAFNLNRHVLRCPMVALSLTADGRIEIESRGGMRAEAAVHPHTTVFSWLAVLLLRTEAGTTSLVLPRDALTPDAHRELRVWLCWKAASGAA